VGGSLLFIPLSLFPQLIANVPNRVNEFAFKILIDFLPQVVDVNIHHIRHGVEGKIPDMLDNHGARHTPSRITHEIFEQGKFAWR
jgi:hypothetical protein